MKILSFIIKRIAHECICIIEVTKRVEEKLGCFVEQFIVVVIVVFAMGIMHSITQSNTNVRFYLSHGAK